jgi:transposase
VRNHQPDRDTARLDADARGVANVDQGRPGGERSPIQVADDAFALLCAGPEPLVVDGAAIGHGLPAKSVPLDVVRDVVTNRAAPVELRDALWRLLVQRARTGGSAWVVGAVGVAVPGLRSAAGRLVRGRHLDRDDLDAQVIAGFLQALREVDTDRPRVWSRLYWAAFHAGERYRDREADQAGVPLPAEGPQAPPAVAGHPDLVLARAVVTGVISREDAELIGVTRLERVPLSELARRVGTAASVLYRQRRRAEQALVAAITGGTLEGRSPARLRVRRAAPVGLTDRQWGRVAPLAVRRQRGSAVRARQVVEAICWQQATGRAWSELPARWGAWRPVYDVFRRWAADGTWARISARLAAADDAVPRVADDGSAYPRAA